MKYLIKIRSVQPPLNGQFSIGANAQSDFQLISLEATKTWGYEDDKRRILRYE